MKNLVNANRCYDTDDAWHFIALKTNLRLMLRYQTRENVRLLSKSCEIGKIPGSYPWRLDLTDWAQLLILQTSKP